MTTGPVLTLWAGVRAVAGALLRTWPRRVAVALVVLVPLVVAAFGGFRTAALPPPPQLAPGEAFDLGPARVHVDSFFVSDQVLTGMLPAGAQGWVGVQMELTVHTNDEWYLPQDVFTVPGLEGGDRFAYAVITQDGSILTQLEPDVPQQVALLFPVPDLDAVGEELQVELRTLTEERSFFEGTMRWYTDAGVAATVAIPPAEDIPPALVDQL